MQLSNITNEDGRSIALLINFLKAGRWDLSGEEADKLMSVRKFVHDMALEAAKQLRTTESSKSSTVPSAGSMKVKAMGPLPGKLKKSSKK